MQRMYSCKKDQIKIQQFILAKKINKYIVKKKRIDDKCTLVKRSNNECIVGKGKN